MEIPHFYPGRFRFSSRPKTGASSGSGPAGQVSQVPGGGRLSIPPRDPPAAAHYAAIKGDDWTTGDGELPPATTWEVSCAPVSLLH